MEQENLSSRYRRGRSVGLRQPRDRPARGRPASGENRERQSTDAGHRGGPARSSDEGSVMELELRGRADQGHLEVNPQGEEPTGRPQPKVKSFEISKRLILRGVGEGPGQQRGAGRGRREHRRVRRQGEEQPLQAVEPDVLGQLPAGAGAGGPHTKGAWGGGQDARRAEHGRPGGPDRGGDAAGRDAGADLPPGQLRLSSWAFRPRRAGRDAQALLESGLDTGPRHPRLLRQRTP